MTRESPSHRVMTRESPSHDSRITESSSHDQGRKSMLQSGGDVFTVGERNYPTKFIDSCLSNLIKVDP